MGNSLGGSKSAKIMKINGESFKLKTPVRAGSVVERYPGHVLLESEAVKHYGVRAKPLEPQQELKPKRLYFLVELPNNFPEERSARRVRSGIHMGAKDRLESLMLARRSVSDLSIMKPPSIAAEEEEKKKEISASEDGGGSGGLRVRMRLRKSEVERLIAESRDDDEVAQKIVGLCMSASSADGGEALEKNVHRNSDHGIVKRGIKSREKRVGFVPIHEGEIQQVVMAS